MADLLVHLLLVAVILLLVIGVAWVILRLILPKLPGPVAEIVSLIFYGLIAILLILFLLVPLIRMLPATV